MLWNSISCRRRSSAPSTSVVWSSRTLWLICASAFKLVRHSAPDARRALAAQTKSLSVTLRWVCLLHYLCVPFRDYNWLPPAKDTSARNKQDPKVVISTWNSNYTPHTVNVRYNFQKALTYSQTSITFLLTNSAGQNISKNPV